MIADPDALVAAADGAIVIDRSTPPDTLPWLPPESEDAVPPARIATPCARQRLVGLQLHPAGQRRWPAESQSDASSAATQPAAGGLDESNRHESDGSS